MQHMRGRTELDRRDRLDLALAPAAFLIRGHGHMRGQQTCRMRVVGVAISQSLRFHLGYENHRRMLEQLFQRLNHRRRIITVHEAMIE